MLQELIITPNGIEERNKVDVAIQRLREFEPSEGYYVAFSGGKDSCTILELCKMAGIKFDAHFNLTTVDPPELIYFIKDKYPEVEIHRPETSMWRLIEKKSCLPTRLMRWCCAELKEYGGIGRLVITGVRWQESYKRRKRRMIEQCNKNASKTYLNAIIDWTEQDVWEFIKSNNIPYCKLYDEGFDRIGCIGCPMGGTRGMEKDFKRWPKYYDNYLRAIARMLKERERKGLKTKWSTAQEAMDWWINQSNEKVLPDQTIMFE